jgi:hypothetical protein
MGKESFKRKILQSRKTLPKKYQKFIETSSNSNISRLVKVCYDIKYVYSIDVEQKKAFKKQKPTWFRLISVDPSCPDSNEKVAFNYEGSILDPRTIEVTQDEYLNLIKTRRIAFNKSR